jgi:DNA-binding CsgD family transcriptional regulator
VTGGDVADLSDVTLRSVVAGTVMSIGDGTWLATSGTERAHPSEDEGWRGFWVGVEAEALREALLHVAVRHGWEPRGRPGDRVVAVVDRVTRVIGVPARSTVLVVEATPFGAREGLDALAAGQVAAVVSADQPSELQGALDAVRGGWARVSLDVIDIATRMPALTDRQVALVGCVMAGRSTRDMARRLSLSEASIKRELGELFRSSGVGSRLELAALGSALGIRPARVGVDA